MVARPLQGPVRLHCAAEDSGRRVVSDRACAQRRRALAAGCVVLVACSAACLQAARAPFATSSTTASRSVLVEQKLSYGAPESYGSEQQHRMPPRSVDSMGDALPPVAAEIEPPGYYKTRGDLDGRLVTTRSGVFYNDHKLNLGVGSASLLPPEPAEGYGVGAGAPLAVEGTAVSSGGSMGGSGGAGNLGPTHGVHEGMDKDDGWAAPYGGFKDLQLGDEPDENSEKLNLLQKGIQKLRNRAREREERVQGKVWREHKRVQELTQQTARLNTWLQDLQYRWDHGPYPVHGPRGPPGHKGEAGPAGANGRVGRRGEVGAEGAPGQRIVVEEIERRHDGPGMLRHIVKRDVPAAETASIVYQRLHSMQQQLAALERANKRLVAKLRASSPISVTFQTHVPAAAAARAAAAKGALTASSAASAAQRSRAGRRVAAKARQLRGAGVRGRHR